tara:strand:+ start:570 stop:851 length:282 start_codon:yes stop_codon:yes gene_type:complete
MVKITSEFGNLLMFKNDIKKLFEKKFDHLEFPFVIKDENLTLLINELNKIIDDFKKKKDDNLTISFQKYIPLLNLAIVCMESSEHIRFDLLND